MRSDDEIKRDVEAEMGWDPAFDATDIGVAVKDGVVTLTGFARSYSHKLQAEADAKRIVGVVGVANGIKVRVQSGHIKTDPELARDAAAAIKSGLPLVYEHIKVIAKNGWVSLEGEVEWNYQREQAENAVRHVSSVKGISNLIKLMPRVAASEIKSRIEAALRRIDGIDAQRIMVEPNGSEVNLRGTVRSWAERAAAERVARQAPGVTQVENRIIIAP